MTRESNSKKSLRKNNTMIAELNVDVIRYTAFLDDLNPETLTEEFLNDFRILPTTFYNPDSPVMFQDFINRWGTHVVKLGI